MNRRIEETRTDEQIFEEWCVVELFGHQRFAGRVTEARFPAGHLRLEIPATDGHGPVTQIINPSALYRMTPTTEEIARAVAAQCRPEPVHRWELESGPTRAEYVGESCICKPDTNDDPACPVHGDDDEEVPF